jgi:predicted DNA-binding transcriptional regulator YafY
MRKGKQETSAAILRQWGLLRRIPRYPAKKAAAQLTAELVGEGLAATKRTVERDLAALAEAFPTIECDDREKPFGWSWARNAAALHLPGMTASEALAFQMIERFIKPLLPASTVDSLQPYLRASSEKLSEVSGKSPAASWAKKVRVVHPTQLLIPPEVNPAVHRAVTEGLLLDRQMEIVYRRRAKSETATYVVNPLGLVQRGPITYFVVNQSKDPFYLALHRISKASLLPQKAEGPPGFDLDQHIASGRLGFGDGSMVQLHAIFANEAAEHLHESPLSLDQRMIPTQDGLTKVVATVPNNRQLEWWLMGFGDRVEILKPAALRMRIRQVTRATSALYVRR